MKNERIILLGQSGSGKDFLMRKLVEKGLRPGLKWTTRPIRKNETDGVTYKYVSQEFFLENIHNLLIYEKFEVTPHDKDPEIWYYGLTKEEFMNSNIFIMTPGELESLNLSQEERKMSFIVYLAIDRDIREKRLFRRSDKNDSIMRRLESDEVDFMGFNDYDLKITDPEFSADDVYELMN